MADDFFTAVEHVLKDSRQVTVHQSLAKAVFQFHFKGASNWVINVPDKEVVRGTVTLPDCTYVSSERIFLELLYADRVKELALYSGGKIKLHGDTKLFRSLSRLFAAAKDRVCEILNTPERSSVGSNKSQPHLDGSFLEDGEDKKNALSITRPEGWPEHMQFPPIPFINRSKWRSDKHAFTCLDCKSPFTFFFRRHHCRVCGHVFCDACSVFRINQQRACQHCFQATKKAVRRALGDREETTNVHSQSHLSHLHRSPPHKSRHHPRSRTHSSEKPTHSRSRSHHARKKHTSSHPSSSSTDPSAGISTNETKHSRPQDPQKSSGLLSAGVDEAVRTLNSTPVLAVTPSGHTVRSERRSQVIPKCADLVESSTAGSCCDAISSVPLGLWLVLSSLLLALFLRVPDETWLRILGHVNDYSAEVLKRGYALGEEYLSVSALWTALCSASVSFAVYLRALPWYLAACVIFMCFLAATAVYAVVFAPYMFRRLMVYAIAIRITVGYLWALRQARKVAEKDAAKGDAALRSAHSRYAHLVVQWLQYLQGAWLKMAQYLSARADILPQEWIDELEQLQDSVRPTPFPQCRRIIEQELGARLPEIFLRFDPKPLASACIAQVHRAVLLDGRSVAVKVHHANMDALIRRDLKDVAALCVFLNRWTRDSEARAVDGSSEYGTILDEWRKVLLRELDFTAEASAMAKIRVNLARAGVQVMVPAVVTDLVTEKVLVMSFCDGFKVTDTRALTSMGIKPHAIVERIVQALGSQIFVDGFYNADPHPGNVFVQVNEQGRVVPILFDFGMCIELPLRMRGAFARMVVSAAVGDYGGLLNAFEQMGLVLKRENPLEDMANIQFFLRDGRPREQARRELDIFTQQQKDLRGRYERVFGARSSDLDAHVTPIQAWPKALIAFSRVLDIVRGLCAKMDVHVPLLHLLVPYAQYALVNVIPRSLHATHIVFPTRPLSVLENRVRALLCEAYPSGSFTGLQMCVYRGGRKVVDTAAGVLGPTDPRPVQPDSLFNVFSITKALCALCVHLLAFEKRIRYLEPVYKYWPEFLGGTHISSSGNSNDGDDDHSHSLKSSDDSSSDSSFVTRKTRRMSTFQEVPPQEMERRMRMYPRKAQCTVAQLLSHQAGLHHAVPVSTSLSNLRRWHKMLEVVSRAHPVHSPGQQAHFHYYSYGWLLGGLVQSVSGQHLCEFARERLARPLGIENEFFLELPPAPEHGVFDCGIEDINALAAGHGDPTNINTKSNNTTSTSTNSSGKHSNINENQTYHSSNKTSCNPWHRLATVSNGMRTLKGAPSLEELQVLLHQLHRWSRGSAESLSASHLFEVLASHNAVHYTGSVYGNGGGGGEAGGSNMVLGGGNALGEKTSVSVTSADHRDNGGDVDKEQTKAQHHPPSQSLDNSLLEELPAAPKLSSDGDIITVRNRNRRASSVFGASSAAYDKMIRTQSRKARMRLASRANRTPLQQSKHNNNSDGSDISLEDDENSGNSSTQQEVEGRKRDLDGNLIDAATSPQVEIKSEVKFVEPAAEALSASSPTKDSAHSNALHGGDWRDLCNDGVPLVDPCMFNMESVRNARMPSISGHFSARALAKMFAMLANGGWCRKGNVAELSGEEKGRQSQTKRTVFVDVDTVRKMRLVQGEEPLNFWPVPVSWGLGLKVFALERSGRVRQTAFGHTALGGSLVFCEPEMGVSCAITVNQLTLDRALINKLVRLVCKTLKLGTPADGAFI